MFNRPAISKVLADDLYAHQRILIDEQAKADHARLISAQRDACVVQCQSTIKRLQDQLAIALAEDAAAKDKLRESME